MKLFLRKFKKESRAQRRPKLAVLSSCLTIAGFGVFSLSGCHPFNNDLSDDVVPGSEKAYDTRLPAGTSAKEIVTSQHFASLLVEIQAVKGFAPSQEALDQLRAFLTRYGNKPKGIHFAIDPPIATQTKSSPNGYTLSDITRIEMRNRRHYTVKGQLVLYALFLDGNFDGDTGAERILGRAYQNTSAVIFMSSLKGATQGAAKPVNAEATVLLHEFGHLMGLVGMDERLRSHGDAVHHTCTNEKCLMNHAAESSATIVDFSKDQIPALDADCENDLNQL